MNVIDVSITTQMMNQYEQINHSQKQGSHRNSWPSTYSVR
jgi:hypothetical protein